MSLIWHLKKSLNTYKLIIYVCLYTKTRWQIVAPGSNLSVCLVMDENNSELSIINVLHSSPGDFVYHRWDLDKWPGPFCRHFNRYATQGLQFFMQISSIEPCEKSGSKQVLNTLCMQYRATTLGGSQNLTAKNEAVCQQMWHDKYPSSLKTHRFQLYSEILQSLTGPLHTKQYFRTGHKTINN